MSIPDWWEFALLTLAAFRTWRLISEDSILERPRRYVTGLPQGWKKDDPIPAKYRERLAEWIECPWCLGFWISLAWFVAWEAWNDTAIVAVPFAISALVALLAKASSET